MRCKIITRLITVCLYSISAIRNEKKKCIILRILELAYLLHRMCWKSKAGSLALFYHPSEGINCGRSNEEAIQKWRTHVNNQKVTSVQPSACGEILIWINVIRRKNHGSLRRQVQQISCALSSLFRPCNRSPSHMQRKWGCINSCRPNWDCVTFSSFTILPQSTLKAIHTESTEEINENDTAFIYWTYLSIHLFNVVRCSGCVPQTLIWRSFRKLALQILLKTWRVDKTVSRSAPDITNIKSKS